ncbi:MAG: peptidyl-prolyl cis-trans isomerase [Opitutales bacterium]|nr:peptidyl-prolyl cis-trans isomerase [Opitutales bacterium]
MNFLKAAKIFVPAGLVFSLAGTALFAATPEELVHAKISRGQIESLSRAEREALEFKVGNREFPRAIIDSKLVSADDVRRETARAVLALRRDTKSGEEFQQKYAELIAETLRRYTEMYLFVGDFENQGSVVPEDYLNDRVNARIEEDFDGDRGKYLEYLRKIGSNPLADRQRLKERVIEQNVNWMLQKNLPDDVSPMDVFRAYHQQAKKFKQPESAEYSQIVIFAGASEGEDSVMRAAKMLTARLKKNPDDFAGTAKIHSRDDYRSAGGYVGWTALEDLSEAVVETLKATEVGQVSDLLELTDGSGRRMFVIFKVHDRRAAGTTALKDVRQQLENGIRASESFQERDEYLKRLQDEFYIVWY